MKVELRKNTLIVTGTNRRGRYRFCLSAVRYLQEQGLPLPEEVLKIVQEKINPSSMDLAGYSPRTLSWPHQIEGLRRWLSYKRFLLAHTMGAGKSKTAIDGIELLFQRGLARRALVICPLSVIGPWKKQFDRHASLAVVHAPGKKEVRKFLKDDFPSMENAVLLIHYDIIANRAYSKKDENPDGTVTERIVTVEGLERDISAAGIDVLILDESTEIKNHRAKRTKSLARISKQIPCVLLMTGTPVSQDLSDIFGQYLVMDPFWFGDSMWSFQQRYCVMGGWMHKQITGYQRENELREIIDTPSHRVTKQQALPYLPPKIHEERIVTMTPKQRTIYNKTAREYLVEFDEGTIDIKNAGSRIMKLQEIANGFVFAESGIVDISTAKVDVLMEGTRELEPGDHLVVWCRFRHDIDRIRTAILEEYGPDGPGRIRREVFTLDGRTQNREEVLQSFEERPGSVLIAQIQTGGLGIDLSFSHRAFIFSNTFEYGLRQQMEDRHHRPGLRQSVTYVDYVTEDTVDRRILDVLSAKKSLSEWVMENRGNLRDLFEPVGVYRAMSRRKKNSGGAGQDAPTVREP